MTSAWYAENLAPDGIVEDGCRPDEAAAMEQYLAGDLDANEGAYRITRSTATSEDPDDFVANLWGLFIDALTELPISDANKIIDLLSAIQHVSGQESTAKAAHLWPHLHHFGDLWGDELRQGAWRSHLNNRSPIHCATWTQQHVRTSHVEALMVVHKLGNIPLSWGLVDICDALESSEAILDIELPAIAEWFEVAGHLIYQSIAFREYIWPAAVKRDLWKDQDFMSEPRWAFWQDLTNEILTQGAEEETRAAAGRILNFITNSTSSQADLDPM